MQFSGHCTDSCKQSTFCHHRQRHGIVKVVAVQRVRWEGKYCLTITYKLTRTEQKMIIVKLGQIAKVQNQGRLIECQYQKKTA